MLIFAPLVLGGLVVAAYGAWYLIGQNVETPAYTVAERDDSIEIRNYPPLVVAEVDRTGGRWEAVNQGFRALAAYIFAKNRPGDTIAMTAPVTQQPAMAVGPDVGAAKPWAVRFIMPAQYSLSALPQPGGDVKLVPVPAGKRAAIRFSGVATDDLLAQKEAELKRWLDARGLAAKGPATYAYYNDPFTPGFLRRNEVMFDLGP
ncbi:MAG: heme-binding protein [Hyphomicrobiales bacterium]